MARTKAAKVGGGSVKAQAGELLQRSTPLDHDPEGAAETPSAIAAEFKSAVDAQEAAEGIEITAKVRSKAAAPGAVPVAPGPVWTASGIGQLAVHLNNAAAMAYDLPEAEPEERTELAESFAGFLTAVWPTGAAYEPHVRFVAAEVAFWTPRAAARIKRSRELDNEQGAHLSMTETEVLRSGALGMVRE
jgi:hypothetical protein